MDRALTRRDVFSGVALSMATLPVAAATPPPSGGAVVDAGQFGCVGDGSTLNDTPLAAALAALAGQHGGVLRLGAGTFLFSRPIDMPAGTVLEGAGMGVTILRTSADICAVTFSSAHSRCGLQSLSLEGTQGKGTGLQIGDHDFSGNHHVRDVIIRGWAVGVRLAGALWTTFDNTIFDQNKRGLDFNAGWNSGYSTTIAFRQCVFSANDFGGVTATNTPITSSNVSWLGCTIERNCHADPGKYPQMTFASGQYGISGFLIDGCYFEAGNKPPPEAIRADGLSCGRIANCTFNDSTYAIRTLSANAASRIAIFGNRFTGSTVQNLHLEQVTEVLAYCNAYGTASNTLTGPGSGSLMATALHAERMDGEWTPVLAVAGAAQDSRLSHTGQYQRIADQVTVHALVTLVAARSIASGTLRIAGLPVPARRGVHPAVVAVSASGLANSPGYTAFQGLIHPGTDWIELVESGSGLARSPVPAVNLRDGAELLLTATYLV
jgi:hypothetical protein